MRRRQMIEQLHPKARHRFVINIDTVMLRKILQRLPHSNGGIFERCFVEVVQRHRDMGTMLELRRQNRRFFESTHQFAHFGVVGKVPYFNFQLYPAGANRVQRNSTITAPITDMMNPAG